MYCKECGAQNPDDVKYCTNCGKSMTEVIEKIDAGQVVIDAPGAAVPRKSLFAKVNLLAIIAGILICVSVFLPFVKIDIFGYSVESSLMDGSDGMIFIVVAAIGMLFAVLGINLAVAITGAVTVVLFLIENSALKDDLYYLTIQPAVRQSGFYLLIAGCILMVIAGIVGMLLKKRSTSIR